MGSRNKIAKDGISNCKTDEHIINEITNKRGIRVTNSVVKLASTERSKSRRRKCTRME